MMQRRTMWCSVTLLAAAVYHVGRGQTYETMQDFFAAVTPAEGGVRGGRNTGKLYLMNNALYSEEHTGPMLATDEGSMIWACNNIFHSASSDRILDKVTIAENAEAMVEGRRNWIRSGMSPGPQVTPPGDAGAPPQVNLTLRAQWMPYGPAGCIAEARRAACRYHETEKETAAGHRTKEGDCPAVWSAKSGVPGGPRASL